MDLNRIYNENCLDTMARMPDDFLDLVVTSPPYDDLRSYKGYSFDFEAIAKELFRVLKVGGVVVWVVGDKTKDWGESLTSFRQALFFQEIGFKVETMIYQKNSASAYDPDCLKYKQVFEYSFVLAKGKPAVFNPIKDHKTTGKAVVGKTSRKANGEIRTSHKSRIEVYDFQVRHNIWRYMVGFNLTSKDVISFSHPATFPEQLAADHIYSWSNEGDLVYDPFMGSGTTAKMAHLKNRKWIGSEISAEYVALAEKRLQPYLTQGSLFTSYSCV